MNHLPVHMVFTHNMADWLGFNVDKEWLEENIRWKDFGTGVRLGRLYREDACSLVLYEADSEVEVDAFMPHSPRREAYIVLEGEVWDEDGTYPTGSLVWMNPKHNSHAQNTWKNLDSRSLAEGVKSVDSSSFASFPANRSSSINRSKYNVPPGIEAAIPPKKNPLKFQTEPSPSKNIIQ